MRKAFRASTSRSILLSLSGDSIIKMRIILWITITFSILGCGNNSISSSNSESSDSINSKTLPDTSTIDVKKLAYVNETLPLLGPVPEKLIIYDVPEDTSIITFEEKCIVFVNYSTEEFSSIKEKSKSTNDWEAFYDDYAYYSNEASLFLNDKATVNRVSNKKYIRFVFHSGDIVTIDRFKAVETIFFFNPETDLRQCDFRGFSKDKYVGY